MANFDDSYDPDLGAACNRLAAFVEPLPAGASIDPASGLTEADLALILRRLYATRHAEAPGAPRPGSRASVPITAKG